MTTLLAIVWVCAATLLVVVSAAQPKRTIHGWSELKRRGDEKAMRRERLLGAVLAYIRIIAGLLLIILLLVGTAAWGSGGVWLTVTIWLVAGFIASLKLVHAAAMRLYGKTEPSLLDTAEKMPWLGKLFGANMGRSPDFKLESPEQLLHLVETAGHILTPDQQMIITRGLGWHSTPVSSVMTAFSHVVSVKSHEMLGPLVLDDLYKTGHSRFPVIHGHHNDVVGILDITGLLDVGMSRGSETAEMAMSTKVLRIESDEPLPHALALLQKSHQHMLVVMDSDGVTAGLVTLSDITRSLLGKTGVE